MIDFRPRHASKLKLLTFAIALIFETAIRADAQQTSAVQLAPKSTSPAKTGQTVLTEQEFQSAWSGVLQSLAGVLNVPAKNRTLDNTIHALEQIRTNLDALRGKTHIDLNGKRSPSLDDIELATRQESLVLTLEEAAFSKEAHAEIERLSQKPTISSEDQRLLDIYFQGLRGRLKAVSHLIIPRELLSKFSILSNEAFDSGKGGSDASNAAAKAVVIVKAQRPPSSRSQSARFELRKPQQEISDKEAVALAQNGNDAAIGLLWKRHNQRIYAATLRVTGNPQDAEDALQEAFLKAFKKIGQFHGDSAFSTWLTRIAINEALMFKRKQKGKPMASLNDPSQNGQGEKSDENSGTLGDRIEDVRYENQEAAVDRRQIREILTEGLDRLSPILRTAFILRDIQGYSTGEAAMKLGVTENTLKARLWRARHQMGEILRQKGIMPDPSMRPSGPR